MTFDSFDFHPRIASGIKEQGFTKPTPIQEQAIPSILKNKDLLGIAQTGTGKTAAFVLPILERLMNGPRRQVRALIIAPTRELASQTDDVIRALGKETGIKSTLLFGGVPISPQIRRLKAGVDVVVACPGRLLDHLNRGTISLAAVEMFILDEADQMFDMGFLPDIRRIVNHLPRKRQTLLFSATMPDDIRKLANKILYKPIAVEVGHKAPLKTIAHSVFPISQHQKTKLLLELFKKIETHSILVFTRTKHRAKRLAMQLDQSGYEAASLQGNLSQNKRRTVMEGFRKGKVNILVATDIAARGIDVSSISHVINYDIPSTAETYTHRIGRTGRATRSGEAFTLVTKEDNRMISAIERLLGKSLERRELEDFDYQDDTTQAKGRPQRSGRRPQGDSSERNHWRRRRRNQGPQQENGRGARRRSNFRPRRSA